MIINSAFPYPVIDKVGIAGSRKDANARNIGLPPEARVFGKQSTRQTYLPYNGGSRPSIVPSDVIVNVGDISKCTRSIL
jgi:hypothetical protein